MDPMDPPLDPPLILQSNLQCLTASVCKTPPPLLFCWSTGGRHDGLVMSALCGSLDFLKYLVYNGSLDLRGENSLCL